MAEVSAAAVKSLREKTGLPMMECKKALASSGGNEEAAIRWLREQGIKTQETRLGRETGAGRIAIYVDLTKKVGAMVEVQCESAPVAGSPDFKQFANDLARQLALGPGATSGEELLKQPSPSAAGKTLADVKDDLFNRMREVFNVGRLARINGSCGGYAHHDGSIAALVEIEGGNAEAAKDVAMHVVAQNPSAVSKENLDPALVQKEREILSEAARKEGKPENIIQKMIEGRLRNFYAERVLLEQPFVKDDKKSVGQYAKENGMQVKHFIRWQMGKTTEA
jgi:elongation factor Ts